MTNINEIKCKKAALKDVAEIVTGNTPSKKKLKDFYGGKIPFITPTELGNSFPILNSDNSLTDLGASQARIIPKDSVLVCCIGSLGKIGYLGAKAATNQQINAVIFDKEIIFPKFGFYALKNLKRKIISLGSSTTVQIVNKSKFQEMEISFPSLKEQIYIAKILDKAINLQNKQIELNKILLKLERNIFVDFFGDPLFNPKSLPLVPLEKLGKLDRGISKHRPRNDPSLLGGPYPLIQTGDISNSSGLINSFHSTYSQLGLKQSKLWRKGTLCITIAANIAKTGILEIDACFPDSIVGFTSDKPENIYYVRTWFSFLQKTLEQQAPESAQKNINLRILRELKVPHPPLDEIRSFSCAIKSLEKIKIRANKKSERLNQLLDSLSAGFLRSS